MALGYKLKVKKKKKHSLISSDSALCVQTRAVYLTDLLTDWQTLTKNSNKECLIKASASFQYCKLPNTPYCPTFISPSAIAGAALVHYLDEVKKCITIRMEINSHWTLHNHQETLKGISRTMDFVWLCVRARVCARVCVCVWSSDDVCSSSPPISSGQDVRPKLQTTHCQRGLSLLGSVLPTPQQVICPLVATAIFLIKKILEKIKKKIEFKFLLAFTYSLLFLYFCRDECKVCLGAGPCSAG